MTALAADRNTPQRGDRSYDDVYDVAASTKIFAGALVMKDASGNANDGAAATGQVALGRAQEYVDNSSGSAADKTVKVRSGIFRWANSTAGDAITKADIGAACYIVDDQTVAKTNGSSSRSAAGTILNVDAQGVWVKTGLV